MQGAKEVGFQGQRQHHSILCIFIEKNVLVQMTKTVRPCINYLIVAHIHFIIHNNISYSMKGTQLSANNYQGHTKIIAF